MVCNAQWTATNWGRLGCFSPAETLGLRFTAKTRFCTGGWLFTGDGAGWVAETAYLFRVSDQALMIQQNVTTGQPNTVYPFLWTIPQPTTLGADYIIAFSKDAGSCFAGNFDNALPAEDVGGTYLSWLFAVGAATFPSVTIGARAGVFPQMCTSTAGFCQYGTQLQPGAQFIYYLTPALIDTWLATIGAPWLAPLFTALWFTSIDATRLCASGPPDVSFITSTSVPNFSSSQILALIQAIAWSQLCQCSPGVPAPIPYPPLTVTQPPGWISPTDPSCSNTDLCTFVSLMYAQLRALNEKVGSMKRELELTQRYGEPFAYIPGAVHSNLSGDGQFAISRLLGVRTSVTARPTTFVSPGNPPYIYNLGWVAITTIDGLVHEHRISRDADVWLPIQMALGTMLQFHFNPGVTCTIQELQAEP